MSYKPEDVAWDWGQSFIMAFFLAIGLFFLFHYIGFGFESLNDDRSVIGSFLAAFLVGFAIVVISKAFFKNSFDLGSGRRKRTSGPGII